MSYGQQQHFGFNQQQPGAFGQQISALNIATVPDSFPELSSMTDDELNELLNDEDRLIEFIMKLPVVGKMKDEKAAIEKRNESIAMENVDRKEPLELKKGELLSLIDDLNCVKDVFNGKLERYNRSQNAISANNVAMNLRVLMSQSDEQAEQLVNDFVYEGAIDVDEFIKKFTEIKKLSYLRKIKIDKLGQHAGNGPRY